MRLRHFYYRLSIVAYYVVLSLVCLLCPVAAMGSDGLPSASQSYLDHWRYQYHIPAIVVTISRPGQASQTYLSGYANTQSKQRVTTQSLFAIGSLTKTFTSAMILRLNAQGKLKLDDPIGKWLPQYKRWRSITIRQLLNMSSGIFRFSNDPDFMRLRGADPRKHWGVEQLIDIAYQHPDYFKPGQGWHYSNTNYLLAELIIEKIMHHPLAWVLQREFFKPLRLTHTFYIRSTIPKILMPLMAHGYQQGKDVTRNDFSVYAGAGAVISNSEDITHWTQALFTTVLPPAQLKQMLTTFQYGETAEEPKNSQYGLGIFSLETPQFGTVWWYTGIIEGYSALMFWIPSQHIAVAVTINRIPEDNVMLLFPQQQLFKYLLTYLRG